MSVNQNDRGCDHALDRDEKYMNRAYLDHELEVRLPERRQFWCSAITRHMNFSFSLPEPPQAQRQVEATASALPDVVCRGPDIVWPADEIGEGSGEEITHEERAERADGREDSAREHRCVPPCEPNRLSAHIETHAT